MPKCSANVDRLRGYRIKIYPDESQKQLIQQNIDVFRASYNLGIEILEKRYLESGKYTSYFSMCKIVSDMRNNNPDFKWLKNSPMGTIRQALLNLDHAMKNFFNKVFDRPRYKTKKKSRKVFMTRSERTYIYDQYIGIPGIGHVYARNHPIPIGKRVFNTAVTFDGYDYWFSCQVERDTVTRDDDSEYHDVIGIDVGIRNMITTSDGEFYRFSDVSKYMKRLKRQSRRLCKQYNYYITEAKRTRTKYEDMPKSKNMRKREEKQFKTYQKIKNKRHNDIHTATKRIVEKFPKAIVIEDISIQKICEDNPWMMKYNNKSYFGMIRYQLAYKAADRNIPIIVADSSYPSSQICSNCGNRHKVYHSIYKCPICGIRIDRDLNAAINLKNLAYTNSSSSYEVA